MDEIKKSLVYTRTGDKGRTSLVGGTRVSKTDLRLEAYGTIDELNSFLGMMRSFMEEGHDNDFVLRIQNCLFSVGGYLATDRSKTGLDMSCTVTPEMVSSMEKEIDIIDSELPPLQAFVIPGGSSAASYCHICRTVCRRVERIVLRLAEKIEIDNVLLSYLNRLSDYLFVLSRKMNYIKKNKEIFWDKSCM